MKDLIGNDLHLWDIVVVSPSPARQLEIAIIVNISDMCIFVSPFAGDCLLEVKDIIMIRDTSAYVLSLMGNVTMEHHWRLRRDKMTSGVGE